MTNKLQDVDISKLSRKPREKVIYVRVTERISKWMKNKNISPSKLFNECAEVLMKQDETSANSRKN